MFLKTQLWFHLSKKIKHGFNLSNHIHEIQAFANNSLFFYYIFKKLIAINTLNIHLCTPKSLYAKRYSNLEEMPIKLPFSHRFHTFLYFTLDMHFYLYTLCIHIFIFMSIIMYGICDIGD